MHGLHSHMNRLWRRYWPVAYTIVSYTNTITSPIINIIADKNVLLIVVVVYSKTYRSCCLLIKQFKHHKSNNKKRVLVHLPFCACVRSVLCYIVVYIWLRTCVSTCIGLNAYVYLVDVETGIVEQIKKKSSINTNAIFKSKFSWCETVARTNRDPSKCLSSNR